MFALFSVVVLVVVSACSAQTVADCPYRTYAGGEVYPQEWPRSVEHSLHYSKAQSMGVLGSIECGKCSDWIHLLVLSVSRPAPFWSGTAVTPNGKFQDMNITDFKGEL